MHRLFLHSGMAILAVFGMMLCAAQAFAQDARDQYRPWHGSWFAMANTALPTGFGVEGGVHISDIVGVGLTAGIGDNWSNDPLTVKYGLAGEVYCPLDVAITPYLHGTAGAGGKLFSTDSYESVSLGTIICSAGSSHNWLQFRAECGAFFASRYMSGGLLSTYVYSNLTYLYIMLGVEIHT